MGIRVYKVLGYGLSDLKLKKGMIIDDRINLDATDSIFDFKKEEFIQFVSSKIDSSKEDTLSLKLMVKALEEQKWTSYDSIFLEEKVIVFTIPGEKDLHRSDDIIDYYEEGCKPRNKVKKIKWGIYPYSASYIRKSTGERITRDEYSKIHYVVQSMGGIMENCLYTNLEDAGFSTTDEFLNEIGAYIPQQIRTLCEFTKIFKDNKTINYLEPMLFTFWR